ncbi:probable protein ABIL5 isoform X1 [Ricinus communis]|uniref:probable protein ABIL5 isoform X1 n=1 Tax=Ricinus communis TaxID=3988 RepID=UPI00201AA0D5|nr:probable protein ABIL5 isoform X1 [Ricinus communis]
MQIARASPCKNSENESENVMRFDKSLQELRDLRSQLHYAADYCESTFLNAKEKKMVVDSTKEYVCRAVVAVVDHLGCVSANLNRSISNTNEFSEAELRIDTLKQRLLSCEKYAHKVALTRVRWHPNMPKFHRRYLSKPAIISVGKSNEDVKKMEPSSVACENIIDKRGFEAADLPLFLYTCTQKSSFSRNSSTKTIDKDDSSSALVLPVRDGVSILSKDLNPTFHFQQISQKHGRYSLFRKSVHSNEILSLIRRIKRTT